jgi:hypothetical protein
MKTGVERHRPSPAAERAAIAAELILRGWRVVSRKEGAPETMRDPAPNEDQVPVTSVAKARTRQAARDAAEARRAER